MNTPTLDNPRMQEMEELLQLAENTHKHIEELNTALSRQRDRALYQLLVTYVVIALSVGASAYLNHQNLGASSELVSIFIVLVVCTTAILMVAWSTTTTLRQRKKILRELAIERDIRARLVSMTFDQFKRLQSSTSLSAVTTALIDIRIRRIRAE